MGGRDRPTQFDGRLCRELCEMNELTSAELALVCMGFNVAIIRSQHLSTNFLYEVLWLQAAAVVVIMCVASYAL